MNVLLLTKLWLHLPLVALSILQNYWENPNEIMKNQGGKKNKPKKQKLKQS